MCPICIDAWPIGLNSSGSQTWTCTISIPFLIAVNDRPDGSIVAGNCGRNIYGPIHEILYEPSASQLRDPGAQCRSDLANAIRHSYATMIEIEVRPNGELAGRLTTLFIVGDECGGLSLEPCRLFSL